MKFFKTQLLSEILLDDDQLKAIGCLVLEVSHLERFVDMMIERLMGEHVANLLTEGKLLGAKLVVFREILMPRLRSKKRKAQFEELYAKIRSDLSLRNVVVHGTWGAEEMKISNIREFFNEKRDSHVRKKGGKSVVKASDVMKLAASFSAHWTSLVELWIAWRLPVPQKSLQ